ncbi:hypothetical protein [Zymobacter sp. IVIA_5232.4 C2]|uniref:zinc ribbon domain-containing protein n=1 Tax=Zymobacter sp. IVIA_5232.4 C2 TaxID=3394855 RepID=UPI0039C40791
MLAKFCPFCSTPLTPDALSCPNCGHMLVTHAPDTTAPPHRRYRSTLITLLVTGILLLIGALAIYSMCVFSPRVRQDDRLLALSHSVGNQEKLFLSERFASAEGIALYRDMIDHELEQAEQHGSSALLGDRLPEALEEVSARRLTDAYARNEFNADARYRNHTLLVDAHIEAVQSDTGAAPCLFVRGKDAQHDIQACLRDTAYVLQDMPLLHVGATQKLICRGDGYVTPSSLLGDCVPLVSIFRQRARELKRSCITHVTRGQLFTRLRDTSHPLHHTKPLMMMLRAEYGIAMFPECRHGWSSLCEHSLQKTRDDEINQWLYRLFQEHGILYGTRDQPITALTV